MTSTHHHHNPHLQSKHDTNLVTSKATHHHSHLPLDSPGFGHAGHPSHHGHKHHQHEEDTSYNQPWSIQITQEELGFLNFFLQMIPHIFSSPYHYELAIAPALGYERAKELSHAMVTLITHNTFSYISPDGKKHMGQVDQRHSHTVIIEMPFSPLYGGGGGVIKKEFVEQEFPPNGDIP
ncbi:hypothetical protein L486_02686 [Kwoniella mangroviensis CBS 10435]|uniref:Uncharacterized protein n=1 Tax=Kwoniella mangroviensis CBS 10435 TaxID=1331196 RepID=A0A1B9IWW5_9TREE|nr:hypothetical protein L486_02686 [Kwoniella mangroviensis CBS 10435]